MKPIKRSQVLNGQIFSHHPAGYGSGCFIADSTIWHPDMAYSLVCRKVGLTETEILNTHVESMVYIISLDEALANKKLSRIPEWMLPYLLWDFEYEYI